MPDSPIAQLVPPVVIISACGLLCLAQFARYSAIIGRLRDMHRERLEDLTRLPNLQGRERDLIADRCEDLERQTHRILVLARYIRNALLLLVLAVICMILSSLSIGVELLLPRFGVMATVTFFILGMLCMLAGMTFVFREVMLSLSVVEEEHGRIEGIDIAPREGDARNE